MLMKSCGSEYRENKLPPKYVFVLIPFLDVSFPDGSTSIVGQRSKCHRRVYYETIDSPGGNFPEIQVLLLFRFIQTTNSLGYSPLAKMGVYVPD